MGFIEEGRQLIQDFVTPEIRAIDARLTAVEKKIESLEAKNDKRFDALESRIDRQFGAVDGKLDKAEAKFDRKFETIEKKFETLDAKIDKNHAQIMNSLHRWENYAQLVERIAKIGSKLQNVA